MGGGGGGGNSSSCRRVAIFLESITTCQSALRFVSISLVYFMDRGEGGGQWEGGEWGRCLLLFHIYIYIYYQVEPRKALRPLFAF